MQNTSILQLISYINGLQNECKSPKPKVFKYEIQILVFESH